MKTKTIPSNYNSMDGKVRNIIELVILDGLYMGCIAALNLSVRGNVYSTIGLLPLSFVSFWGIGGQSLTQALFNYIRFLRRRRVLTIPTQEYIREKNKAIMLKNQKLGKESKGGKQ